MSASFAEIRRAAPPIHVFKPESKYDKGGVTVLEPKKHDTRYDDRRYSEGATESYTEGDGSRENPYRYLSAAPVSAHYETVDLWSRFRDEAVFIKINDWLLEVSPEGVTASDDTFTKLA
jgi:hypothetical protein